MNGKWAMERRDLLRHAAVAGVAFSATRAVGSARAGGSAEESHAGTPKMANGIAGDLRFSHAEYERRYRGVRSAMAKEKLDALVVIGTREWSGGDSSNIHYLGAPAHLAELSLLVVPAEGKPISPYALFGFASMPPLPPGMRPPWIKSPSSVEFDFEEIPVRAQSLNSPDYAAGVVQMFKNRGLAKGKIGFVSMKNMPADIYAAVREQLPDLQIVDAQHILLDMRLYKSAEEILFMQRSGHIADKGLEAMMATAGPGVSDYDVFYAIDQACAEAGAPVGGFQLYGSGPWQGPPGSTSNLILETGSARTIQPGDLLIPEVTSNYKGYFTQLTVPAAIGEPPKSFLAAYDLCARVHAEIRKEFTAGKTVRQMDAHVAEFTEDVSRGEFTALFGVQAGEHEYSMWHLDYELNPGAMVYNQPFFFPLKKPGGPFHVFGDAMIMTEQEPLILHQSSMDLVVL